MERSSLDPLRAAVAAVAIHQKLISHATPLVSFIILVTFTRCTWLLRSCSSGRRIRPRDVAITLPLGMHQLRDMGLMLILRRLMLEHKQLAMDISSPGAGLPCVARLREPCTVNPSKLVEPAGLKLSNLAPSRAGRVGSKNPLNPDHEQANHTC